MANVDNCIICDEEFVKKPKKKLCDKKECKLEHRRQLRASKKEIVYINCDYCGKEIIRKQKHQRFCSNNYKCKNAWFEKNGPISDLNKRKGEIKSCKNCGKEFVPLRPNNVFCCRICKDRFKNRQRSDQVRKECKYCKKEYRPDKFNKGFCSLKCRLEFFSNDQENGCIIWTGKKDGPGYGQIHIDGKSVKLHRYVYEQYYDVKLNSKQFVCHKCDTPACINVEHLFVGSQKDNMQDASKKGRMKGARGEKNGATNLTKNDVKMIRQLYSKGIRSGILAEKYNVSRVTIVNIAKRKTWNKPE